MGHIRTSSGSLVCASCPSSTQVVARRCPYDCCPSIDLCPDCYAKHKASFSKKAHAKCKVYHDKMIVRRQEELDLLNRGLFLRRSALSIDKDTVHVLFMNNARTYIGFTMSRATYHAIGLGVPATDAMYREHGTLTPAEPEFSYAKGE